MFMDIKVWCNVVEAVRHRELGFESSQSRLTSMSVPLLCVCRKGYSLSASHSRHHACTTMMDSPSGTISSNQFLLLYIALVMLHYHSSGDKTKPNAPT